MKNIKYLLLLITVSFFPSCEEVIEVDLDTAAPRLVVDASIDWVRGTDGSQQTIKLSATTGYYDTEIPPVSGATVFITNSSGTTFDFTETPGTGDYVCNNFVPVINETYTLTVIHDGYTYTAVETLRSVPEITNIIQDNEGGFLGEDIEVRFFFQDNGAEDNWYLTRFDVPVQPFPEYDAEEDRFNQGNEMFNFYSDEDLKAGDVIGIRFHSISQRYYNYMIQLSTIAEGGSGGGPFQTPPTTVRGNLVNQTDINNFALGYFRLCEVEVLNYTIQ